MDILTIQINEGRLYKVPNAGTVLYEAARDGSCAL